MADEIAEPFGDGEKAVTAPSVTQRVTSNVNSTSDNSNTGTGEVTLSLVYPDDVFYYGQGDDEVLRGRLGKKFSRSDADKILESAERNGVQVTEIKEEGDE